MNDSASIMVQCPGEVASPFRSLFPISATAKNMSHYWWTSAGSDCSGAGGRPSRRRCGCGFRLGEWGG